MRDFLWRRVSILAIVVLVVVGFQGVNAHRARAGGVGSLGGYDLVGFGSGIFYMAFQRRLRL